MHNQTRVGHEIFVSPDFYVAESGKLISIQSNNSIAVLETFYDIFGRTSSDTGTSDFSRIGDGITNDLCVFKKFILLFEEI